MKSEKFNFKGVAFQSWLYIVMFSVFILVMLFVLQVFFLNTFYEGMKTREIVRVGEYLTAVYGSERFEENLQEYAFKNGVMAVITDESGMGTVGFGFMTDRAAWRNFGLEFNMLKQAFEESGAGSVHFTGGERGRRFVVYMSRLAQDSAKYLIVMSPLPPIDSTAKVLQLQLHIIMAIILLTSLIVARLLSRKLSVSIIDITKSARRMAQGDYSVSFSGGGYSEVDELADALNYAASEISKTDRYQKELVANVSHDLRTPLTLIKFYGEMVRDVSGDDRVKRTEACDTIIKEADWLTVMVNELLELSKLQLNDVEPVLREFNISDCLRGIMETVSVVENDGYLLKIDIVDGLTVKGDEYGLKRAMYNLIGNALNYTGDDKCVTVRLREGVRFEVLDTGDGVPEQETDKIWDRYYKSGEVHRRGVLGTGLGLSIAKTVLDAHGAEYGVSNLPEGGAMFWFKL